MNINFSDQNCLIRYNSSALRGETGPDGQYILGHTDVLINDKHDFVNAKRSSHFDLVFWLVPIHKLHSNLVFILL